MVGEDTSKTGAETLQDGAGAATGAQAGADVGSDSPAPPAGSQAPSATKAEAPPDPGPAVSFQAWASGAGIPPSHREAMATFAATTGFRTGAEWEARFAKYGGR